MSGFDTDVMVIGGGPVGMTVACELARYGIRFRIIDKKSGPVTYSQAGLVQVRTQEILDAMGIVSGWRRAGYPMHEIFINSFGKQIGHIRLAGLESPYPGPLTCPQSRTEELLLEHLKKAGVPVERPVEATEISQDANGCRVKTRDSAGKEMWITSRYVISCEGSRSTTRETLGIPFEGERYEGYEFIQTDATLEWTFTNGRAYLFQHHPETILVFPFSSDGLCRVLVTRPDKDPANHEPPTLEEIEGYLKKIADPTATLKNPVWLNRFRCQHRKAVRFREKNIFLAGDSGHVHIPLGGQGMNTGIQDAFNLAWKLAYVNKGWSPASLLDTYDSERGPVAEELVRFTDTGFNFIAKQSAIKQFAFRNVGPLALHSEMVQDRIRKKMGEFDICYPESALTEDHLGSHPHAGDRAPAGTVVNFSTRSNVSLFDIYRGHHFTCFLFAGHDTDEKDLASLLDTAKDLSPYGDRVKYYLVTDNLNHLPSDTSVPVLIDRERIIYDRFGAGPMSVTVVRPDWYIGYKGKLKHASKLKEYFKRLLSQRD